MKLHDNDFCEIVGQAFPLTSISIASRSIANSKVLSHRLTDSQIDRIDRPLIGSCGPSKGLRIDLWISDRISEPQKQIQISSGLTISESKPRTTHLKLSAHRSQISSFHRYSQNTPISQNYVIQSASQITLFSAPQKPTVSMAAM